MKRLGPVISMFLVLSASPAYAGCILYEHRDYGGDSLELSHHDRVLMEEGESLGCAASSGSCESILREPGWDDIVSSFRVTPGCTLVLWEDIDDEETTFTSKRSYKYVGSDWNDETSEALCMCEGF